MNGRRAKALRRSFLAANGRAPMPAKFGGKVTRFVDRLPTVEDQALRKPPPRVVATLFEKVLRPSEWRSFKRQHAS